jgi:hypothetical protein
MNHFGPVASREAPALPVRERLTAGLLAITLAGGHVPGSINGRAAEPGAVAAPDADRADATAEDDVKRPLMVSEAALPEGFPPPGPVNTVIVKTYPAHRLARATQGRAADGMFMKLFRHIERNKIAMTAPVVMDWPGDEAADAAAPPAEKPARRGGQPEAMAFLYGKATIGAAGADPADAAVVVEDVPETTVVSIGLRGGYDEATLDRGVEKLRAFLAEHPEWTAAGPPRSLAYNSPFVPAFAKYSEAQIPVVQTPPAKP